jgi:pSer/pThr/pTyr-binding forkhead associated (FHA) protein
MGATAAEEFAQAGGAAGAMSVLVIGPGESDRRRLLTDGAFLLVGRHPRACVSLTDERVSPRHLYLQVLDGHLYGIDLGSETGVYHGLARLSSGWVAPSSFLRLGPYHVSVTFDRAAGLDSRAVPEDPLAHRAQPSTFTPLSAEVFVGNIRRTRWKLTRRLVLFGRGPMARLRLQDKSVSSLHCAVVGTPHGSWVVDLLSREGTFVNETPVRSARLRDGDRLRVGCYELSIRTEDHAATPLLATPTALPPFAMTLPGMESSPLRTFTPGLPAHPADASALLPILLQQFGLFQQQMLEQFQQSMMQMMQTFAQMNNDQMGLIREELAEIRRLNEELHEARHRLGTGPKEVPQGEKPPTPEAASATPPPMIHAFPTAPPPDPHAGEPAPPAVDVHDWLSGRIANLEQQRQSVLQRALRKITGS